MMLPAASSRHATGHVRSVFALVLALAVAASACTAADEDATGTPATVAPTEVADSTSSTVEDGETTAPTVTAPDGFELILGWLNGTALTEEDYDQAFTEGFADAISFADLTAIFDQLRAEAPYELVQESNVTDEVGQFEIRPEDQTSELASGLLVSLRVEPDSGRMSELLFEPVNDFVPPASVEEAIERLEAIGRLRLVGGVASNGSCAPSLRVEPTEVMPLASVFKLYVLGAVADAIERGEFDWDTPVVVRDELDSLPTGTLQDAEPGTEVTVVELAEAMISISDNTATDHLIDLVGREAVEDFQITMGNGANLENKPFLTTRELFILLWGDPELGEAWAVADPAGRRELVEGPLAEADLPAVADVDPSTPVLVEEVGWFASPLALCDAMNFLAERPETARILALNPGIDDGGIWQRVLFKGGSAPGVVSVAWRVETAEGEAFVLAGSVVDADGPIDTTEALLLLAYLRDTSLFANEG